MNLNKVQYNIQDIYTLYTLNDKDMKKLKELTGKSMVTLKKYIHIQEKLDIELFPHLDSKNKKLTIDTAYDLVSNIVNKEIQCDIFYNFLKKGNKINKGIIKDIVFCNICCDSSKFLIKLPCCGQYLCENCLLQHINVKMTDITFQMIRCLFCSVIMKHEFLDKLLYLRYVHKEEWMIMNQLKYNQYMKYNKCYLYNILQRYYSMLIQIENKEENRGIYITDINIEHDLPKLLKDNIYGPCFKCSPHISTHRRRRKETWDTMKIKGIPRSCMNDENNELVIKKEMFQCETCSELETTVKKCPHCNVKTVRPNECNFVICQCKNFWCFLCGSRLFNDHNGHNVHYYMGPGSGPFSNKCRVTENHKDPSFEIKSCQCIHCITRGGKSICLNLNCNNTALESKKYCGVHQE